MAMAMVMTMALRFDDDDDDGEPLQAGDESLCRLDYEGLCRLDYESLRRLRSLCRLYVIDACCCGPYSLEDDPWLDSLPVIGTAPRPHSRSHVRLMSTSPGSSAMPSNSRSSRGMMLMNASVTSISTVVVTLPLDAAALLLHGRHTLLRTPLVAKHGVPAIPSHALRCSYLPRP